MTLNQKVAATIRARYGWEYTPDQIDEMRREAYAKLRKYLSDKGYTPPATDDELTKLLRSVIRDIPSPQ